MCGSRSSADNRREIVTVNFGEVVEEVFA